MKISLSAAAMLVFLLSLFSNVSSAEENGARNLFEKKCSACHSLNKVTSLKKNAGKWKKTVSRMSSIMERKGKGKLSDNEIRTISDYLIKNYGR